MKHHAVFCAAVGLAFAVLHASARARQGQGRFDVCEEKTGIINNAKATVLASAFIEKCSLPIVTKYKFTPRMIQLILRKLCLVFRFCFHKHQRVLKASGMSAYSEAVYPCVAKMAPLLTTKLNRDYMDTNVTNPGGIFKDGVECVAKRKIFTDDVAIAMAGIKWVLENFF
ncbi:uncharacterized protein LOC142571100 isoform X1 [Dermacentor variabilis]|uniref:uncharacterized protein LOC142571100 isoform X1 n=1 Tax=Dermacentor variabilis TaxID=34621 RepID=UPI003F5B87A1